MKSIKTQLLVVAVVAAVFGASSAFASNTQTQVKASARLNAQHDSGPDIYKHDSHYYDDCHLKNECN